MNTAVVKAAPQSVQQAADLLQNGELVGLPTETVYGLAANALDDTAVRNIFTAKGRPQDNPLISHIASIEMLPMVARAVPAAALALAEAFWPGPLTIVLPRSVALADSVCAGLDTAGVRMPSHPVALQVIAAAGVPLAAPSANLSGSPSPTTASDVYDDLNGRIPLILDGGACDVGVESTVISLAQNPPLLLRPGFVTKEQMEEVLGCEVQVAAAVLEQLEEGKAAASPGMKYKHYAPKAEITIIESTFSAYAAYIAQHLQPNTVALCFDGEENALPCTAVAYGTQENSATQATNLFSALRQLDALGAKTVFARCPQKTGVGLAVYNRLLRAAAFRVVRL